MLQFLWDNSNNSFIVFFFVSFHLIFGLRLFSPDMLQYLRDNSLTIDLETMNPVEMPTQADAKMEAFFPYPAANTVAKYSLGLQPKPSEFADAVIVSLGYGCCDILSVLCAFVFSCLCLFVCSLSFYVWASTSNSRKRFLRRNDEVFHELFNSF